MEQGDVPIRDGSRFQIGWIFGSLLLTNFSEMGKVVTPTRKILLPIFTSPEKSATYFSKTRGARGRLEVFRKFIKTGTAGALNMVMMTTVNDNHNFQAKQNFRNRFKRPPPFFWGFPDQCFKSDMREKPGSKSPIENISEMQEDTCNVQGKPPQCIAMECQSKNRLNY